MKKLLTASLALVVALAAGLYLFRGAVLDAISPLITSDMFVAVDDDAFDPGIAVGTAFPAIDARHQGRTISSVAEFVGEQGLVFFANRSADW